MHTPAKEMTTNKRKYDDYCSEENSVHEIRGEAQIFHDMKRGFVESSHLPTRDMRALDSSKCVSSGNLFHDETQETFSYWPDEIERTYTTETDTSEWSASSVEYQDQSAARLIAAQIFEACQKINPGLCTVDTFAEIYAIVDEIVANEDFSVDKLARAMPKHEARSPHQTMSPQRTANFFCVKQMDRMMLSDLDHPKPRKMFASGENDTFISAPSPSCVEASDKLQQDFDQFHNLFGDFSTLAEEEETTSECSAGDDEMLDVFDEIDWWEGNPVLL
jgi:hypothetical protein